MPNNQIAAIHPRSGDPFPLMSDTWAAAVEPTVYPNYTVIEVFGSDASRSHDKFKQVSSADVALIMGIGHGVADEFFGWGNAEVLYNKNIMPANEVRGKVVHLFACSTALSLGRDFITSGLAAAFIGYNGLITFGSDTVNKNIATADAEIDLKLAAGQNVSQAIQAAQTKYHSFGLDDVGALLESNPANCMLQLPSRTSAAAPNEIASHDIARPNSAAAPNTIVANAI